MSRAGRRYYRTIALGVLALGCLVWVAVDQFGVSRSEVSEMFLGALLVMVLVIAAAALVVFMWMGLRKLLRRNSD